MGFVKKYLSWLLLALGVVVLLAVNYVYVGSLRSATASENMKVVKALQAAEKTAKSTSDIPTRLDIKNFTEHLGLILKEGRAVQEAWRKHTDGLNFLMGGGKRKDGEVTDPRTVKLDDKGQVVPGSGEPIIWDLYDTTMPKLYELLFMKIRRDLALKLVDKVEVMLADENFAGDNTNTREDAEKTAKESAPRQAAHLARVLPTADDVCPVRVDERFFARDKERGWEIWRHYLITRDVLGRALINSIVELERTLCVQKPLDDAERTKLKAEKMEEIDEIREVETAALPFKEWRFIESVDSLEIVRSSVGDSILPAPGTEEEKEDELADKDPAYTVTVGEREMYYDEYTMTISVTAHLKVIEAFMREILRGDEVFYVPVSATVTRFEDGVVMGRGGEQAAQSGEGVKAQASRPVDTTAGFSHEPPVRAVLVYNIYRFRYTDTDNAIRKAVVGVPEEFNEEFFMGN